MRNKLFLPIIILLLTTITSAGSIGISPASFTEHFDVGMKKTFSFKAFGPETGVRIYLGGELREYATLSKETFKGEESFQVTLNLPKTLSHPGVNTLYVGVMEAVDAEEVDSRALGGVAAIQAPIRILVPYPGKYLESRFRVKNLNEGENAAYTLDVDNLGTDKVRLAPKIEIYKKEDLDTAILTKTFNETVIETRESRRWNGNLDTEQFAPGDYIAYATLNYGPKEVLNSSFSIGKQFVEILDYDHLFDAGVISPMNILVRSKWNSIMKHVYAEITVTEGGTIVDTIKTPSFDIEAWQTINLTGFLDARELPAGRYLANILVRYGEGKTSNKLVAIYLNDKEIEEETPQKEETTPTTRIIIISIIIIWLLYLLIRIRWLKRKIKKK